MTGQSEPHAPSPAVRRIAGAFRLFGWISFWIQLVLGVVAAGILLLLTISPGGGSNTGASSPGTGAGLFLATGGILALFAGALWAFRYTRLARQLRYGSSSGGRPTPKAVLQALQIGLFVSLIGMLLTLLGAEIIVGSLFVKSLSQLGAGIALDRTQYIQPLDIFIVQASTHTAVAHFAAIAIAIYLFRLVNR